MSPHAVEFGLLSASGRARQDYDMYMIQHGLGPDRPQDLDAVMPGKMEVEHNDTGMGFGAVFPLNMDELKRFLAVGDDLNFDISVKA
jgi:hypothetical protein